MKMSNDGKKIAFSFSKVKKPALLNKVETESKEKKEYVDCFDGSEGKFSYKGSYRNDSSLKQELVIPMPVGKTSADMVRSRIEERIKKNSKPSEKNGTDENKSEGDKETSNTSTNLEELAALEILNEVKNSNTQVKHTDNLIIKTKDIPQEPSENDIDYDNIPVTDFGLAMLRGMGWKPNLGIGKEPRLVEAIPPKLRLKGLGLGAQLTAEGHKKKQDSDKKDSKKSSKVKQEKH